MELQVNGFIVELVLASDGNPTPYIIFKKKTTSGRVMVYYLTTEEFRLLAGSEEIFSSGAERLEREIEVEAEEGDQDPCEIEVRKCIQYFHLFYFFRYFK